MILQGRVQWAMVLGAPRESEYGTAWSFDFLLTPETKAKLLSAGMSPDYIKNKDDERGDFVTFKRNSVKQDGEPAKPYQVVDANKEEWPQTKLIGNGSVINVKVALNEVKYKGKVKLKPTAIALQVWEHVPYVGTGQSDFSSKDDGAKDTGSW